jgi:hypothetical protein
LMLILSSLIFCLASLSISSEFLNFCKFDSWPSRRHSIFKSLKQKKQNSETKIPVHKNIQLKYSSKRKTKQKEMRGSRGRGKQEGEEKNA